MLLLLNMNTDQQEILPKLPNVEFYRSKANEVRDLFLVSLAILGFSYVAYVKKIPNALLTLLSEKTFSYESFMGFSLSIFLITVILTFYFLTIKKLILVCKLLNNKDPEVKFSEKELWTRVYKASPW